jgi:hypothetical protein
MIGIGEKADLPDREALGDNDPSTWPVSSLTGQREDPWKEQMTFPIVSQDDRSYSPGLLAAMTVSGSSR